MSEPGYRSVEDVFNSNLDAVLAERGITHRDLLERLEAADYTPDTPATVLLNDAVAIAAVLGMSPLQLFIPEDEAPVDVTPSTAARSRELTLWLRGLRPLSNEEPESFFAHAPLEDLDAELVAENWVWSERLRTTALVAGLDQAVKERDLARVKLLTALASRHLDQPALERTDDRVPRFVKRGDLRAAVERATRFRRQGAPPADANRAGGASKA